MFDLEEELLRLREAFDAEGVEFALYGGMATAVAHRLPAATLDIEILVRSADIWRANGIGARFASHGGFRVHITRVTRATERLWRTRQTSAWRRGRLSFVVEAPVVDEDMTFPELVDYSSAGITLPVRQVSQLRKLALSLGKAKPLKRETAAEAATAPQKTSPKS